MTYSWYYFKEGLDFPGRHLYFIFHRGQIWYVCWGVERHPYKYIFVETRVLKRYEERYERLIAFDQTSIVMIVGSEIVGFEGAGYYSRLKREGFFAIFFLNSIMVLCKICTMFPHIAQNIAEMSGIFPIFHCNWNIVAIFLSHIAKYFIATLQFQLSEIFLKTNKYLILSKIL